MHPLLDTGFLKAQPKESFFDSKKISLNQTNLCIALRSKKGFFGLKKSFDCFFSLNLRNECLCSHISTCVMLLTKIFSLI